MKRLLKYTLAKVVTAALAFAARSTYHWAVPMGVTVAMVAVLF
jgi:hypothetical protein